MIREILLFVLLPYLMGSIPFGYVIGRWLSGRDIREVGSGNIGAANALRSFGLALGLMTLILDACKGVIAVLIPCVFMGASATWCGLAALSAILGHLYPAFLKFKGGKGFATFIGGFLILTPLAMMLSLVTFIAFAIPTRIASVGSLTASAALPIFILLFPQYRSFFPFSVAAAVLIFVRHSSNIRNLIHRVEPKIGEKR
jgi:glycerol-3-phosphate acyltransferase PlsY